MIIAAITNPYDLQFETDIINRLFREGLAELHIRKPEYTKEQYKSFIAKIDRQYHARLVLHSYFGLVHTYQVAGIHLDQEWRTKRLFKFFLRKIILRGKAVKKYATTMSSQTICNAECGVDEFAIGPVFANASHNVQNPLMKIEKLERIVEKAKVKVAAVGGVSKETIGFFKNIGFEKVVLQSALWKSIDPIKSFIAIRDFEQNKQRQLRVVFQ